MSGLFDWLKRSPPLPGSTPKSQLPALRKETLPAALRKEEKKLSPFDIFKPKAPSKAIIQAPAFFSILTPPPAPPQPPKVEKEQETFWGHMFPPATEPEAPLQEIFEILKPEPVHEVVWEPQRFIHPDEWPFGEPPLWSTTPWHMPTAFELAEVIRQRWDLPGMYEYVLSQVEKPGWMERVEESAHTGEPAAIDVQLLSTGKNSTFEMANFLRIPDFVVENYGDYGREGIHKFAAEVLKPMFERVGKAIDVFRPARALRGWFELEPDTDMNFWIRYKEVKQYPQLGR